MIDLTFNLINLLISISLIIALSFGAMLLIPRQSNRQADRFLAALMFVIALWNASLLTLDLGIYRFAAGIIWIPMTFSLALGPCFYFYVRFITQIDYLNSPKIWPHFIPVLLETLLFFYEVFQGLPLGLGYFQTNTYQTINPFVDAAAIFSFVIYGYFARQRIKIYHCWVKQQFSDSHRYNLNWLQRLSTVFLVFLVFWLSYFVTDYFIFEYQLSIYDYYPFHLTLAVISIWLCVEAFAQNNIIFPEKPASQIKQSKIVAEESDKLKQQAEWLTKEIEENLLYLDPELSLRSLADTLEIHPNLVSKVINDGLQQTFTDCINQYRVAAVKKQLEDPSRQNNTFLAIAYDCGFNSKATFNRVFKKQTGKTPLQYRDQTSNN